jgi:hypothetical protein
MRKATRATLDVVILVATVAASIVIGFGVPLLWIWIGSMVEGDDGVTTLSFSVVCLILGGIIATYVATLYVASWVQGRIDAAPAHVRAPWLRSMRDTPYRAGAQLRPLERVFVTTTMIVSAVFWVWFFFIAGSPLPNQ